MDYYYAGIDVSLEASSVCSVDATGKIIRATKVASEPDALIDHFASLDFALKRIGLEAGPLSQWLHEGLTRAGFDVVLLETRHVKAALSAMTIKTDRKDARGIAQLLRMGWYRTVHSKSPGCQDVRALLTGRKLLQAKLRDLELSIRGILRGYGLKVGEVSCGRFEARILELVEGHAVLKTIIGAMLQARHALWTEFTKMHREMLKIVRQDRVRQRLMTTPGWRARCDHISLGSGRPNTICKISNRRCVFRLTPKKYQSGETDLDGGISRVGDTMVRTALYEAAHIMLTRV